MLHKEKHDRQKKKKKDNPEKEISSEKKSELADKRNLSRQLSEFNTIQFVWLSWRFQDEGDHL